jgi:hypothetical protein
MRLIALAGAALMAATAAASARPDARAMSCGEVRSLIRNQGAAVITTGRNTYDRYVRNGGMCDYPSVAAQTTIPTRDGSCPVLQCRHVESVYPGFRDM